MEPDQFSKRRVASYENFLTMFALSGEDFNRRILVYPALMSNFGAKMAREGYSVVSADAYYQLVPQDMDVYAKQIFDSFSLLGLDRMDSVSKANQLEIIKSTVEDFLQDYPNGKLCGRYVAMEMPQLPTIDGEYDLALYPCIDVDFSNPSNALATAEIITELCRSASSLRVYFEWCESLFDPMFLSQIQDALNQVTSDELSFDIQAKPLNQRCHLWHFSVNHRAEALV